jgi:hypothetical protein
LRSRAARLLVVAGLLTGPGAVRAEPIFLSKQYTRCTSCHYSPTGGGLLTPYGRSLSRELSTTGAGSVRAEGAPPGEEGFLFGALGNRLGPLDLGLEARPARLRFDVPVEGVSSRNLMMTLDLLAAVRKGPLTVYGSIGRQPENGDIASYEHWAAYRSEGGLGVRAGRFLPAYGVRLADHTAFTREELGLGVHDQVYGVEVSHEGASHLVQVAAAGGRADAFTRDDGPRAFTASARLERDLGSRTVLAVSGLYRAGRQRAGMGGAAFGHAPHPRVSLWTELDAQFRRGELGELSWTLFHEAGFEAWRGVWVRVSPQLRTDFGDAGGGTFRVAGSLDLLPRTHWHLNASYYHDRLRRERLTVRILLLQLHLYL